MAIAKEKFAYEEGQDEKSASPRRQFVTPARGGHSTPIGCREYWEACESNDEKPFEDYSGIRWYLDCIGRKELLTEEEERELVLLAKQGDEVARQVLIERNLRLVVSVARDYTKKKGNLEFKDLIQYGNMGLIRAIDKFDPEKKTRVSTYAVWWIRQNIARGISDEGRTIRIPVHSIEDYTKIRRASAAISNETGADATFEQIAEYTGFSQDKVEELFKVMSEPMSTEMAVGEESDSVLGDFIEDAEAKSPEDLASIQLLRETIFGIMNKFSDREKLITIKRFGLDGRGARTLEEIGQETGITRERVRQIEKKIIEKFQSPTNRAKLEGFLDLFF